jgi:hypothetical protein
VAFVTDGQAAVAKQSGDSAFNHPPVLVQYGAGFDALGAMRGVIPRWGSQPRSSVMSYAFSAWSLVGRCRRRPRRERTGVWPSQVA